MALNLEATIREEMASGFKPNLSISTYRSEPETLEQQSAKLAAASAPKTSPLNLSAASAAYYGPGLAAPTAAMGGKSFMNKAKEEFDNVADTVGTIFGFRQAAAAAPGGGGGGAPMNNSGPNAFGYYNPFGSEAEALAAEAQSAAAQPAAAARSGMGKGLMVPGYNPDAPFVPGSMPNNPYALNPNPPGRRATQANKTAYNAYMAGLAATKKGGRRRKNRKSSRKNRKSSRKNRKSSRKSRKSRSRK